MIRNLYEVLAEADSKPKAKSKEKPKAKPVPREEPILTVKLVDGKKTRDSIAVDFIGGGHYYAYPDLIPKDEVWIEQDLAPDEQADILVHELVEYALMSKGGMTYTPAHNLANKLEKVFRNFEGRWKTKQAPDGDKKVEEAATDWKEWVQGKCEAWAKNFIAKNGGEAVWIDDLPGHEKLPDFIDHQVVVKDGKYYDAINPKGVDDWHDLSFVKWTIDGSIAKRCEKSAAKDVVKESLLTESYNRALMPFIKYLNGGIDPYDFSHMLNDFFEEEEITPPEDYDENAPYEFLESAEFEEHKDQFVKWLGNKLSSDMSGSDAYAPTYLFMTGAKLVPRQTWLIHFSDDAYDIASNGFEFGAEDFTAIGLTTHLTDNKRRKGPGWNFAFKADDRDVKFASKKYGEEAVLFQSAGVEAYHSGDNEQQVVFWGPNVKERFYLQNSDGEWVVRTPVTDKELVRNKNIFNVINWVKQNHGQYRKVIANDQKAKPIQPTPKADRENLLAKPPEKTPQPFEAVEEKKIVGNSTPVLVVVHPGSLCGSLDFNLGAKKAAEVRKRIAAYVAAYKGTVIGVMGDLNEEIDNYPEVEEIVSCFTETIDAGPTDTALKRAGRHIRLTYGKNIVTGAWGDAADGCAYTLAQASKGTLHGSVAMLGEGGETPKGVCPKCGLAKHRSIPHLCSKGRSKWGAKGGKFTTPERPAFKTKPVTEGEEDLLVVVKQYASNKHPDDHAPEDYHWARDKAFNTEGLIHMMPGGLAGWRSFLGDAVKESPDKYAKLSKTEKIDDPVILSPGHIWDGWHRIAAAIVNGHKTIPAIVGKLNAR
jgi:hypothetical protein